jgi:hypothetical protein
MKLAYLSESEADEAALKILTEAVLKRSTQAIPLAGLRHRGWPAVQNALPAVLRALHYRTDAEGLVILVDSNCSPPHLPAHDPGGAAETKCRLCQLRRIADETLSKVHARSYAPPLRVAIGLAVPAIEAWLLCGVNPHVTEAAWFNALQSRDSKKPYSRQSLKEELYGTSRPSLPLEKAKMAEAARRLAKDLSQLKTSFPNGFGTFAETLQGWVTRPS